jgi:hypothetical protein
MQDAENHDVVTLANQITERYGLLISQTQLAELLGRTTGGLRYNLSYPNVHAPIAKLHGVLMIIRPENAKCTCYLLV